MRFFNLLTAAILCLTFAACNQQAADDTAENDSAMTAAIDAFVSAWNNGDMDKLRSATSVDFVRYTNDVKEVNNQDEMANYIAEFRTAFPDANVTLNSIDLFDDKSIAHWTFTGTNNGEFNDAQPTGQKVTVTGISEGHWNDEGKMTAEKVYYDQLSMMTQLGYTVAPPAADDQAAEEE